MKVVIATIAAIGAMSSCVGSAIADVSINFNFGTSPSYRQSNQYKSYRSNVYQSPSVLYYPKHHSHYHRNLNSGFKVYEVYPSNIYSSYGTEQRYNSYQGNQYGDSYIVEKRIIRVR
jgi:hypothetical protein